MDVAIPIIGTLKEVYNKIIKTAIKTGDFFNKIFNLKRNNITKTVNNII